MRLGQFIDCRKYDLTHMKMPTKCTDVNHVKMMPDGMCNVYRSEDCLQAPVSLLHLSDAALG